MVEQRVDGSEPLPTAVPVHFAVTLDAVNDTAVMYVDGTEVGSESWTLTTKALGPLTSIWLGRSQYSADAYLDGSYDEVRIYVKALTRQQIRDSYTAGPAGI